MREIQNYARTLVFTRLPTYIGYENEDNEEEPIQSPLIESVQRDHQASVARAQKQASLTRAEIAARVNANTTRGLVSECYHMTPQQVNDFGNGVHGGMGGTLSGAQLFALFNYITNRGNDESET